MLFEVIAAAIAVNHAKELSYVWDTTECRLVQPSSARDPSGRRSTPHAGRSRMDVRDQSY